MIILELKDENNLHKECFKWSKMKRSQFAAVF